MIMRATYYYKFFLRDCGLCGGRAARKENAKKEELERKERDWEGIGREKNSNNNNKRVIISISNPMCSHMKAKSWSKQTRWRDGDYAMEREN